MREEVTPRQRACCRHLKCNVLQTTTTSTLILTMAFTVGFMIGSVTVNHKPQMLSPKTDSNYEL